MSSAEPPQQPTPRGLSKWVREESFWKDVTTRTIAGLIVVMVVWGVGIVAGVFDSEGAIEGFIRVFEMIALVLSVMLFVAQWRLAEKEESIYAPGRKSGRSRAMLRLSAVPELVIGVALGVDLFFRAVLRTPIL